MYLLALDCSTSQGSVALVRRDDEENHRVFGRREFAAGRGHGGEMFTALQAALDEISATGESLDGILVGLGPGSYSGVRQAIAAATGIAAGTGAWLRGVPSAVAFGGPEDRQIIGDARRGAFYYTAVSKDGVCVAGPELLADEHELAARLEARPGWLKLVAEAPLPGGVLHTEKVDWPQAGILCAAPFSTHQHPPLEPIYLRPVSITLPAPRPAAVP